MSLRDDIYYRDTMTTGTTTDNAVREYTLPRVTTNSRSIPDIMELLDVGPDLGDAWGSTVTSGTQEALDKIKEENKVLKDTIKALEKRLYSLEEKVRFVMEI